MSISIQIGLRRMVGRAGAIIAAIVAAGSGAWAQRVAPAARPVTNDQIVVTGIGRVNLKPTVARITFNVQANNNDIEVALRDNIRRTRALVQAIADAGINKNDIQADYYSITRGATYPPNTGRTKRPPKIIRFFIVGRPVRITLRDITSASRVIKAAVKAQVFVEGEGNNNIALDVADITTVRAIALQRAVADARAKARIIAKASGVGDITVIEITEGGDNSAQRFYNSGYDYETLTAAGLNAGRLPSGLVALQMTVTMRFRFTRSSVTRVPIVPLAPDPQPTPEPATPPDTNPVP